MSRYGIYLGELWPWVVVDPGVRDSDIGYIELTDEEYAEWEHVRSAHKAWQKRFLEECGMKEPIMVL